MAHSPAATTPPQASPSPAAPATGSDPLSRFVNWFSSLGAESSEPQRSAQSKDAFSQLMNRISG